MGLKARIFALAVIVAIATFVAWRTYPRREIRTGEHIEIQVSGTLLGAPIFGTYRVDEDGKVTLGPAYGRVAVAGLDTDSATARIASALHRMLKEPEVAVSRLGDDALSRVEAENHRLQTENAMLQLQLNNSRITSSSR